MVECTGLENRRALTGSGGSNPSPTALLFAESRVPAMLTQGLVLFFPHFRQLRGLNAPDSAPLFCRCGAAAFVRKALMLHRHPS